MFFRYNYPALLWAFIIFILCSFPGNALPEITWLELISFDKFVHAGIFFVLQILLMRGFFLQTAFPLLSNHYLIIPLVLSIVYGGLMELMQRYVFLSRSGDVLDFIANSIGCFTGMFSFPRLHRFLRIKG